MRGLNVVVSAALAVALSFAASGAAAPAPVVVAVVDTGVDASVAQLATRLTVGYSVTGPATADGGWHGTAIASIVAAEAPGALVMPVRVLDGSGTGADVDIARGVVWAVDHGARVVNLSLAGPTEDPSLHAALRYAVRRGVVVVAAAGNDGSAEPSFPGADPLAIGVAGVTRTGALSAWSNRGRWVAIAAPGVNATTVPGNVTFDFPGTSSAAAVVSGIVAACLEAAPSLSPAALRRLLVATARPLPHRSFGVLDAERMLAACRGG